MKIWLLTSILLLSGCSMSEEIYIFQEHPAVCDIMDVKPNVVVKEHFYVDEIIR